MALKDWKKVGYTNIAGEIKHYWRNKKDGDNVILITQPRFTTRYNVTRDNYTLKIFKTEQQALKFAKEYMRTH